MNVIDEPLENPSNAVDISHTRTLWTWVKHILKVRDNKDNDILLAQLNFKLGISGLVRALYPKTFFLKSAFYTQSHVSHWMMCTSLLKQNLLQEKRIDVPWIVWASFRWIDLWLACTPQTMGPLIRLAATLSGLQQASETLQMHPSWQNYKKLVKGGSFWDHITWLAPWCSAVGNTSAKSKVLQATYHIRGWAIIHQSFMRM